MKYLLWKSDGSGLYFPEDIYITQKFEDATPTNYAAIWDDFISNWCMLSGVGGLQLYAYLSYYT